MDLDELRDGIDSIDDRILDLFLERMDLCRKVADYKKEHSLPVFQGGREDEIIGRIRSRTGDPRLETGTAVLFRTIMDISKNLQNRSMVSDSPSYDFTVPDFAGAEAVACQGVSGANSEMAAEQIFGKRKFLFFRTFEDVFKAVESGKVQYGVLPMNNSTAGSVSAVYDLMSEYSVYIVNSVCLEINHCLAAARPMAIEEISRVYSHSQAIAQCSDFIYDNGLKATDYGNTALAAEYVSKSGDNTAAICSAECARQHGLCIIAENIADCSVNRTRFICISRDLQVMPEADTVSVMLKIPHVEGSLYRLLTKFCINGMNLSRIENRPVKDGSFEVMFYLDFGGRITDPNVKALLNDLAENLEYFRFLGTFRND